MIICSALGDNLSAN